MPFGNDHHDYNRSTAAPPNVENLETRSAESLATPHRRRQRCCNNTSTTCHNPRMAAFCRRCLPKFMRNSYERQYTILVVMTSPIWRVLMFCSILILLFGAQVQNLWCPKSYDTMFDILYTVVFGIFLLDIFMRMLVVPGYIGFKYKTFVNLLCRRWRKTTPGNNINAQRRRGGGGGGSSGGGGGGMDENYRDRWSQIHIGSFLFWCDIVSTCSILYEISYINKMQTEIRTVAISLDTFGIPTEGQINQNISLVTEVFLLVTIGKTVRVVRFVRSSRVAKWLGKINWYWPCQVLNPRSIIAYCCCRHRRNDANAFADDNSKGGKNKSGGPGGGASNKKNDDAKPGSPQQKANNTNDRSQPSDSNSNNNNRDGPPELMRSRSWGGLGLATLAAVKAHNLAKEEQLRQERGAWGKVKKVLWKVGILRNDKAEWQRQLAATKIQRAWRKAKHYEIPEKEENPAWQERSMRKSPSSAAASFRNLSMRKQLKSMTLSKQSLKQRREDGAAGSNRNTNNTNTTTATNPVPGGAGENAAYFDKRHGNESQVGGAMRELTGQRVAIGIILSLVLTVIFTYAEGDSTRNTTMIVLHIQTAHPIFANASIEAARDSSVPDLYQYDQYGESGDNSTQSYEINSTQSYETLTGEDASDLRNREILQISVTDTIGRKTVGWFAFRNEQRERALGDLLSTIFILLIWLFGVTAFVGPVMVLVVLPIERMVRLLGMLMLDPLGYQSTSRYRKFVAEEDILTKNTRWTKENLRGMETSFLMSTILRIGSLMKVGFGSAGVEIIRQNLQKRQGGNVNLLTSKGVTVNCIFLFCDIRQFTDATECLQEEVFVFTNRIAAVVHSYCHSHGGSANKNIGDAFLCSWSLDDPKEGFNRNSAFSNKDGLVANNNQADKCLLCVVKICMALHHDQYYVETMSDAARDRLLTKLSNRPGPVVQMGCGLHAGKAVQGAIGSERKIDATYVSEAVEMAEFLESSTKKYGVNMLMSDSFHRLLHSSNRYRCRIVDQLVIQDDENDEEEMYEGDVMELYTYDINIDALWELPLVNNDGTETISDTESFNDRLGSRREMKANLSLRGKPTRLGGKPRPGRRMSLTRLSGKSAAPDMIGASDEMKLETSGAFALNPAAAAAAASNAQVGDNGEKPSFVKPELVLPTGPALYNANIWRSEQMLKIRETYSDGLFFHKFNSGLQSFYAQDWDHAKQCFQGILDDCLEDGPSKYFLAQIEQYNGKPPPNFKGYGVA